MTTQDLSAWQEQVEKELRSSMDALGERIKELNFYAKQYAERQFEERPETKQFSVVEGIIDQLSPYYGL